jgi:hypothetical protein
MTTRQMARPARGRTSHVVDIAGRCLSAITGLGLAVVGVEVIASGIALVDPVRSGIGFVLVLLATGIAHLGNRPGAWA